MAVDSMAKATIHEPVGAKDLWKHKGWQLPAYIQHVANDLREAGHPESRAIAMAVGIIKNWAHGHDGKGKPVHPDTQAAAAKALAEWEALKARAAASRGANLTAEQTSTVDLAAWDGAKHPRVSKGKAGGGRFAGKNSDGGPPADVQAQVRDFQRRHGLPQTGQFDAATTAAIHYHASGAAGKAASASKKHAKKVASAKKKADAAARRAAKAKASAARKKNAATASAVNKLTPAQRKAFRAKSPVAPAGYVWATGDKLKTAPTPTQAAASASVAKTLSLAEQPFWRRVIDLGHPHPGQRYKHGWIRIDGATGALHVHRSGNHEARVADVSKHEGLVRYTVTDNGNGTRLVSGTAPTVGEAKQEADKALAAVSGRPVGVSGPATLQDARREVAKSALRAQLAKMRNPTTTSTPMPTPGVSTGAKTPGFNSRISIFYSKGKAYRWSPMQQRSFPIGKARADMLIAQGHADLLPHHPIHGPEGRPTSLSEQATGIDLAMSVTSTTDGPALTVPAESLTSRAKRVLLRRKMAMPPATAGGEPRFPIRNHDDVKKAVRAVGRAKGDHAAVRRHVVRRAKAINAMHLIPDHWSEK